MRNKHWLTAVASFALAVAFVVSPSAWMWG